MNHLSDEQLQSILDNEKLTNLGEIQDHLNSCESCKTNLDTYRKIYDVLASEEIPGLSANFVQSTIGKLKKTNDKKWIVVENITISIMFIVSLLISIYLLNYFNVLAFFRELDFSLFTDIGKKVINVLSPNIIYILLKLFSQSPKFRV